MLPHNEDGLNQVHGIHHERYRPGGVGGFLAIFDVCTQFLTHRKWTKCFSFCSNPHPLPMLPTLTGFTLIGA